MKSTVVDNIYDGSPFWFWMKANGMLESVRGGRWLSEPLRFAKSDNVQYVTKGSSVALVDKEFLTTAKDEWRYLVDVITRYGVDEQQNAGKNQILSLLNAKLANSNDSLADEMETRVLGSAGTNQFNGLQDIVASDPTAAPLHGIDGNVETWWQNQFQTMTGASFAGAGDGLGKMFAMVALCSQNLRQDAPDIILAGRLPFQYYWTETITQRRIHNKTLGDAGFQNIEFMGIPMVWSPQGSTNMYFLNTRFLKFKYDPAMNFDMTEWKAIPSQINDRVAQVILAGNLMTSRRRVHGVIFLIDTA
jgi:hypothetical protein